MRGQAVYLLLDLTKCRTGCKFIIVLFLYHSIPVFLSITHEMHRFSLPVRDREKIEALHFCSVLRHETCQPVCRGHKLHYKFFSGGGGGGGHSLIWPIRVYATEPGMDYRVLSLKRSI